MLALKTEISVHTFEAKIFTSHGQQNVESFKHFRAPPFIVLLLLYFYIMYYNRDYQSILYQGTRECMWSYFRSTVEFKVTLSLHTWVYTYTSAAHLFYDDNICIYIYVRNVSFQFYKHYQNPLSQPIKTNILLLCVLEKTNN